MRRTAPENVLRQILWARGLRQIHHLKFRTILWFNIILIRVYKDRLTLDRQFLHNSSPLRYGTLSATRHVVLAALDY